MSTKQSLAYETVEVGPLETAHLHFWEDGNEKGSDVRLEFLLDPKRITIEGARVTLRIPQALYGALVRALQRPE